MSMRRAFTLVEILLVVAIIAMLISIVLPIISKAKGHALEVRCKAHIGAAGKAFYSFAGDHGGILPAASHAGWQGNEEDWQACWIGKEGAVPGAFNPPKDGPLVKYLGGGGLGTKAFWRCDALIAAPVGSGLGSNGGFDFTMFLSFSGARIKAVPQKAKVIYMSDPFGPSQFNLRTPLIIEEDPAYHCNSWSIEPGFGSIDRSAKHHVSGGSIYVAVDGGVDMVFTTASRLPQAWEWFVSKRPNEDLRLNGDLKYGDWKTR
jgi:prepilin-type N-terminal cleavage/methylation domain-containing protein